MDNYFRKVDQAVAFLTRHFNSSFAVGLLTGTGLGDSAAAIDIRAEFNFKDIPNFPVSTVESHYSKLLMGYMHGKPVIAMQGRFHLYEGYSPLAVAFPIRVMQQLGVRTFILTNASGGLNADFSSGDIMIICDHINLTGTNPLMGPNEPRWGPRFPEMRQAYDPRFAAMAERSGAKHNIHLQKGVYAGLPGPSLETPAEVRFLQAIGADAVGFSTIQEVIAAVHAGMRVLAMATITNVHDPDNPLPATVEKIIAVARQSAPKLGTIISDTVRDEC